MIRTCRHVNPQKEKMMGGIHPYFEMLYVISGRLHVQWMGESYSFQPHSLILLHPNTPHQVFAESADCSFWFMELDIADTGMQPGLKESVEWNRQMSSTCPFFTDEPAYGITLNLLTAAICSGNIGESGYNKEMACLDIQKLLLIIKTILNKKLSHASPASDTNKTAQEAVLFLMRYMETEYSRPITLQTMSDLTHFNPSYLIRMFKKSSGVTPAQYLQTLRLHAAACYLTTTALSIEEISRRCGYQSIHYFSQSFKRKTGDSPTGWRTKLHNSLKK